MTLASSVATLHAISWRESDMGSLSVSTEKATHKARNITELAVREPQANDYEGIRDHHQQAAEGNMQTKLE